MKHNHTFSVLFLKGIKVEFKYNQHENLVFVDVPKELEDNTDGDMISFYHNRMEAVNQELRHGADIDDYKFRISSQEPDDPKYAVSHHISWKKISRPSSDKAAPILFKMAGGGYYRKVDNGFIELDLSPKDLATVDEIFKRNWT